MKTILDQIDTTRPPPKPKAAREALEKLKLQQEEHLKAFKPAPSSAAKEAQQRRRIADLETRCSKLEAAVKELQKQLKRIDRRTRDAERAASEMSRKL